MHNQPELDPVVINFINQWIETVKDNPSIVLGQWLYAFGAMSGLALKSQSLSKEQASGAVDYLNKAITIVYNNVDGRARIQ